jgi:hypothetical protein
VQHDRQRVARADRQDVELPARGRHSDLLASHTQEYRGRNSRGPRGPSRRGRHTRRGAFSRAAPRASPVYQVLCSHFTLNAVPPDSADTESLARPLPFTMMILVGLALPIAAPFTAALLK